MWLIIRAIVLINIPAIIAIIHFVLLLISSDEDFNAKYGTENK